MMTPTFPSLRSNGITLIAGLGQTGLAAARWCLRGGQSIRVVDTRSEPGAMQHLQQHQGADAVEWYTGLTQWDATLLEGVSTVVVSPGLSPLQPPLRQLLEHARQRNLPVVAETEMFALALHDLRNQGYRPRVAAITGTNGKTTVTSMVQHILAATGCKVRVAGNIAPAGLDALMDALDHHDLPQAWVIELSSFQLERTHSLQADIVALLNISQDHLDWHGSMQAYVLAKAGILSQGEQIVLNRDDPRVMALFRDDHASSCVQTIGLDKPAQQGDVGVVSAGGMDWLAECRQDGVEALLPVQALQVMGPHNVLNAQAALLLAQAMDVTRDEALAGLRTYQGEPHRMAFVRSVGGVSFVNDSKGTNVAATVAALQSQADGTVLIAGGQGKGQDFSPLMEAASGRVRSVVLIGEAAAALAQQFQAVGVTAQHADTLDEAVRLAFEAAHSGGCVMLSPACASHDMFSDYIARGHAFIDAVNALALDQGEVA